MPLSAKEAQDIRTRLELSPQALAYELGLTPTVVEAWERGEVGVPAKIEMELRWRTAVIDRHEALAKSGLPECDWLAAWEAEPVPDKLAARNTHLERAIQHHQTCETCQARETFARETLGEMPPRPMPWWMHAMDWINTRAEALPVWARPAVWVGLAFGAYTLVRIVFLIPAMSSDPGLILTAIQGLAASVSIGAVVGVIYGTFRMLKSRWQARRHAGT